MRQMRRSSIGPTAVVLAVATTGPAMLAWTGLASPGSGAPAAPGAISQQGGFSEHASNSKQGSETDNCANYIYKNGRLVRVSDSGNSAAGCSASANGTSGRSN